MANIREKDFSFGVPKIIAFTGAGKNVPTQIAGADPQVRFTTTGGDAVYLNEIPAGDVERELQELGIAAGESFRLTRHKTTHGGSRFSVERAGPGRDAGGHNVPERHSDAYEPRFSEPVQRSATPVAAVETMTPMASRFSSADMVAIDTLIAAREYAQRKGLALEIRCEDVRARAATIMIDQQKGGR